MNKAPTMSRLISVPEAAAYLRVSPDTIYTWVSQRRIPFTKMGKLVKFDEAMLQAWIKQHTVMPMPPQKWLTRS